MNAPKRLLFDPSASPRMRELLESFDEQPTDRARRRTLAALGLGAIATSGASLAPKAGAMFWLKLGAIGVFAIGLASAVVVRSANVEPIATSSARIQVAAHPAPSAIVPTTSAQPLAVAPPSSTQRAIAQIPARTHPTTKASAASHAPSLDEQISALDGARAAADAGDHATALARLDAYEARFPRGTFTQEAEALRVRVLSERGDEHGAAIVAQRFLATWPQSPHKSRVRAWAKLDR